MPELEPITREEKFLNGEVGMTPITREEKILAGEDIETVTRREYFLKKYRGGGGGDITVESLSVTSNGTYTAPSGKAYSPVEVDVPLPENAYLLKSVTTPTPIASFNDGEEMVMPTLKVAIEPQQEGSGDPSPTNIRPISGWSEVNVYDIGKNFYNPSFTRESGYYDDNGVLQTSSTTGHTQLTPIDSNTEYYFSIHAKSIGGKFAVYFWDANRNWISRVSKDYSFNFDDNNITFTTPNNCRFISFQVPIGASVTSLEFDDSLTMICLNSLGTNFEAYNGSTYTIDLDGTRYGGKVDVVNGTLTVTHKLLIMSDVTWLYSDSLGLFYVTLSDYKRTSTTTKPNAECEVFNVIGRNKVLTDRENGLTFGNVGEYDNRILVRESSFTDLSTFESAISGKKLVYELATPLTIQLTPTQVKSLLGQNNVWADTGDITDAEYFSKEV